MDAPLPSSPRLPRRYIPSLVHLSAISIANSRLRMLGHKRMVARCKTRWDPLEISDLDPWMPPYLVDLIIASIRETSNLCAAGHYFHLGDYGIEWSPEVRLRYVAPFKMIFHHHQIVRHPMILCKAHAESLMPRQQCKRMRPATRRR